MMPMGGKESSRVSDHFSSFCNDYILRLKVIFREKGKELFRTSPLLGLKNVFFLSSLHFFLSLSLSNSLWFRSQLRFSFVLCVYQGVTHEDLTWILEPRSLHFFWSFLSPFISLFPLSSRCLSNPTPPSPSLTISSPFFKLIFLPPFLIEWMCAFVSVMFSLPPPLTRSCSSWNVLLLLYLALFDKNPRHERVSLSLSLISKMYKGEMIQWRERQRMEIPLPPALKQTHLVLKKVLALEHWSNPFFLSSSSLRHPISIQSPFLPFEQMMENSLHFVGMSSCFPMTYSGQQITYFREKEKGIKIEDVTFGPFVDCSCKKVLLCYDSCTLRYEASFV